MEIVSFELFNPRRSHFIEGIFLRNFVKLGILVTEWLHKIGSGRDPGRLLFLLYQKLH